MTVALKVPGDEITLTVSAVAQVPSEAKPGTFRYQIDGLRPDGSTERTYLNCPVVDKQLKHMGLPDAQALVGGCYRFYRIAAPNNTPAAGYLNIDVANGKAPAPTKRLSSPQAPAVTQVPGDAPERYRDVPTPSDDDVQVYHEPELDAPSIAEQKEQKIASAYTRAWAISRKVQHGVGTPDSVQAGAATLVIAFQKAGLC